MIILVIVCGVPLATPLLESQYIMINSCVLQLVTEFKNPSKIYAVKCVFFYVGNVPK